MKNMSSNEIKSRSWWLTPAGILLLTALLSSVWAWWLIAAPVVALSNVQKHDGHFGLVYAHMTGGTIMLLLGATNLYIGSTRNFFRYHKIVGYTYLIGGSAGALLALVLALANIHGDTQAPLAFDWGKVSDVGVSLATLAGAWLVTAALAYRAARNRRIDSHRAWVIRSYVLTWSFVLCRLAAKAPALADIGDGAAIVWLSWVAPLFMCEIALQWKSGGPLQSTVRG